MSTNIKVEDMFSVEPFNRPDGRRMKRNGGPPSVPTPAHQQDTRKMIDSRTGKPLGDLAPWPPKAAAEPAKGNDSAT